jgi:hypothetical protein
MKKYIFFILFSLIFISCKKSNPASETSVTGVLLYSEPAADGAGLVYYADNNERLLFKNHYADEYTEYLAYKDRADTESRLTYTFSGETGCTSGMTPCSEQHKLRVVEVISLVKQ